MPIDHESLKEWFLNEKRIFPWRNNPTPYGVWVSEVMLQQTQAAVVVPYFERWMARFPSIASLAGAPIEEVIKMWEGLGYYSRARNLHAGARLVMKKFDGEIPRDEASLKTIKGLGPYTIGAIRSFAFRQKASAVDGNVIRVLTRYLMIGDDIAKPKTVQRLRETAFSLLPEEEHWIFNEALIELGATICKKKPLCSECPLKKGCLAYANQKMEELPVKSGKIKTTPLYRSVAVVVHRDQFLLKKGKKGEIMEDLYEFPYFETDRQGLSKRKLSEKIKESFRVSGDAVHSLPEVIHTFTRFKATLRPVIIKAAERVEVESYEWVKRSDLGKLPFSSGHKKILYSLDSIG